MSETAPGKPGQARERNPDAESAGYDLGRRRDLLAFATELLPDIERIEHASRAERNMPDALMMLDRIFDNVATLKLKNAALEAERGHADQSNQAQLHDAMVRIHDLERSVADLARLVARLETMLQNTTATAQVAEQRAFRAETSIEDTRRGTSEAVEWLYRYLSVTLAELR